MVEPGIRGIVLMKAPIYGGNSLKQFILLQALKEEAHKQLSYYRQKQDDLVARMATEWPTWGCTLDFYSHMILPLLKNSFILNFMNRSEGFGLNEVAVKFAHVKDGKLKFVKEEFQLPSEGSSGSAEPVRITADLIDFCLSLLTNVTDVQIRSGSAGIPVSDALAEWRISFKGRDPLLVRIRDADIGAQSFFALLEGIMRNASKHGLSTKGSSASEKPFGVHIAFCSTWEELTWLVELDLEKDTNSANYSYIVVSLSRDLLLDPVKGAERKTGGLLLVEYLRQQFKEGIIDERGKVSPGNWGIKEMKTCAAFLGGESLYAVNDRDPKFILVGKTQGNEMWPDGLARVCYVVRVEKPRVALAVVPEHKLPVEHWEAVRFVTDVGDLPKGNVDYDFLYIDQEISDRGRTIPNRSTLPQRIVYGDFFNGDTHKKSGTGKQPIPKEIELSSRLYDEVLSQYLETLGERGKRFRLRLYFEDNDRALAWEGNIEPTLRLPGERTIEIDFLKIVGNSPENKFASNYDHYQASIFRHSQLSSTSVLDVIPGERIGNSYYPYYAQQVSGSDPFFSFLLSLEPGDNKALSSLVMRQIAEAALLNILIIDERIAQSLTELKAKDEPNILLAQKLSWMGIYVAGSLQLAGEEDPIWQNDQKVAVLPDLVFDQDGFVTNTVGDNLPVHILLIHATRLNGIFDRLRNRGIVKNKEELLEKFRKRIGSVIVHSGRGKTEGDIPDSAPFLEYSTVEKYVLNEPSKFYLVQIVRNVKGEIK